MRTYYDEIISDPVRAQVLEARYHLIDNQPGLGDVNYVIHELAHYAVLFRRIPTTKADVQDMQQCLDVMPCGRAQLHELRVMKLEHLSCGIAMPQRIAQTWFGIVDAVSTCTGGRNLVTSKTNALRRMRAMHVSPLLVTLHRKALETFLCT